MRSPANAIWRNESGAIAALYALALPALIVTGGIAFDYARLAAMDSELQNAADQAALAAVTQLDQQPGACSRASAAAVGLVTNSTLFANDGGIPGVTVTAETACDATGRIRFWQNREKTTAADKDTNARFVEVTVNARTARYALTPIVGAFSSGAIAATAYAGLGSAICKVPPVMICNPQETGGNTNFDVNTILGAGLKLVTVGAGGSWAPGNFGYLDTGGGSNGANGLREALGWVTPPGDCVSQTGVDTKPGATVDVVDSMNTRFDIYDNTACQTGGACPASINAIKDLVRNGNANGGNSCKLHNSGWKEVAGADQYLPTSATAVLSSSITPKSMGHPRDMCHAAPSGATGACTGPIGTGAWDRNAYFRVNYPEWANGTWTTQTGLSSNATRYQVYAWEIDNRDTVVGGHTVLATRNPYGNGASLPRDHDKPVCSPGQGYGAGLIPAASSVDRRRISVAVVNCTANSVNGASNDVPVVKWLEIFLVEPSLNRNSGRSSRGDIYVEVIGETLTGSAGSTSGQVVRRDLPYLIE